MDEFKGVEDTICDIKGTLDVIQTTLEDTLTRAQTVMGILNDKTVWAGEAQLVGAAFLDLVVQYHEKLAHEEGGPVIRAAESLQEYLDSAEAFYENWQHHVELMGIG